jgi:hypothetical protein
MNQEKFRFPEELATDVKLSQFYTIENSDIATEDDLDRLVELMFHYPERNFYLFGLKEQGANHIVVSAEQHGILRIERYETQYYAHPKFERDWVKIDKRNPKWDWEKNVIENSPEYIRFTLKLTERWRKKMELGEALSAAEPKEDKNPLLLKPNFFGMGIDLPKAWDWLKAKCKKWF